MLKTTARSCSPASEWRIEPGRLQFIETNFGRYLHGSERMERIRSIHDAIFVEGKPLATVFHELARSDSPAHVIAVTSGKGGVGKTTVSVNLAVTLASQGRRVLLFDADLGMANAHLFAGVNPKATLFDVVQGRATLSQVVVAGPAGVQLICGASGVAPLADLGPALIEKLCRELAAFAQTYDVLLIDTGAGISSQVLKFLEMAAEIVVVTTPNLAAVLDAYGVIKAAREARLTGRIRLLVNQAGDSGQVETVYNRIRGCAERFLQLTPTLLGSLARDPAFEESNQRRIPLALSAPGNPNSARLAEIALTLTGTRAAPRASAPVDPPRARQNVAA